MVEKSIPSIPVIGTAFYSLNKVEPGATFLLLVSVFFRLWAALRNGVVKYVRCITKRLVVFGVVMIDKLPTSNATC